MRFKIFGVVLLFVGLVQSSFGSVITNGNFSINGTVYVVNNGIDPDGLGPIGTCGAAGGCIVWQSGGATTLNVADVSISGLPNGDIPLALAANNGANIFNLTNPPNLVGGIFANQLFMNFAAASGVTTALQINTIVPGNKGAAGCGLPAGPNQQCTPPGSLFNFENNALGQATATWIFTGVTSGNPGSQSNWIGNFTAQFGIPFQTVLANLGTAGFVSNTYSAIITLSVVPEPGSLLLIGTGLIGLAAFLRRRTVR